MSPKDNFSLQSDTYARYRPHYPDELYDYLNQRAVRFDQAWDCATGNGQVAHKLVESFDHIIATDISRAQLDNAIRHDKITYETGQAEKTSIADECIDLITVGQAIHWFDHEAFYKEVKRVSRKDALLAYWSYGLLKVNPEIDKAIHHFHYDIVGKYWDPERKIWQNEYQSIKFPLANFERKDFEYSVRWDIKHLEGYLNSWSAVQHYIKQEGINPVGSFITSISHLWKGEMTVTFPIFLYAGNVR